MLGRDLPERVSGCHGIGVRRGAGVGSGTGVENVNGGRGRQQSPQPSSSVYSGVFHPRKIIEERPLPNRYYFGWTEETSEGFRRIYCVVKYMRQKVFVRRI